MTGKKKYVPPRVMRMEDTRKAAGLCSTGSGDADSCYEPGNSAGGFGCDLPGNSPGGLGCIEPGNSPEQ